jgi:WD40 repeat protein
MNIRFIASTTCLLLMMLSAAQAQRPQIVVQTGHPIKTVRGIAFSADGKLLASSGFEGSVKIWDVATGLEVRTITGPQYALEDLTFSPDNKTLAASTSGDSIKFWDVATGHERQVVKDEARSVVFSPDGKLLAGAAGYDQAKVWDVGTGQLLRTIKTDIGYVHTMAFSHDGKTLAGGADSNMVQLWNVADGRSRTILKGPKLHEGASTLVWYIAFMPGDRLVVTGGSDDVVRIWDSQTGQQRRAHDYGGYRFALSPDGKTLATNSHSYTSGDSIKLFDLEGHELRLLKSDADSSPSNSVNQLIFSPDNTILACSQEHGGITLWDVASGSKLLNLKAHSQAIKQIAYSPDSKTIASGGLDSFVRLWDATTGRLVRSFHGHDWSVESLAFSPDGKLLASGSSDLFKGVIKIWDVATGTELRVLSGQQSGASSLAFSPDGKVLASGSQDNSMVLWKVETGSVLYKFKGPQSNDVPVHFSPDGKLLAYAVKKDIKLFDLDSQREIRTLQGHTESIFTLAFSPDSKKLVSGSFDKTVIVWDVATGRLMQKLSDFPESVLGVAFHSEGKTFAIGFGDSVQLRAADTGALVRSYPGNFTAVVTVAFSPDGKRLAAGCRDTQLKLWDTESGEEVVSMISLDESDYVTFTPDDYYISSKSGVRGVAFRINDRAYPFEQFDLRFNRPDIVLERLGASPKELIDAYRQAYKKRLNLLRMNEEMLGDDFQLPELAVTTRNIPVTTKAPVLKFTVKATSHQLLLDRLNVLVNDVPIYGSRGIGLKNQHANSIEQEVSVELARGNNRIQVSALNENGLESLKTTFNVTFDGPIPERRLYVVAIGVSLYADKRYTLSYADKDALDLIQFWEGKKRDLKRCPTCSFTEVKVLPILNQQATKENIVAAKAFLMQSKIDDEVVLFLAGHGTLSDKLDYYFGTTDIDFQNPAVRGLPYEAIEDLLDGIPARRKLLLMDTCHSGEVDKDETRMVVNPSTQPVTAAVSIGQGVKSRPFPRASLAGAKPIGLSNTFELLRELFTDLRLGSGATVISAAGGVEYAYESAGNGVFTYAVLSGLRGKADQNKDGTIKVSELRDYVMKTVRELTKDAQKPTSRRENIENDFSLY